MFLVFPGKRPFILWFSTSLRQFDWDRSKYSSKDRELDPCHDTMSTVDSMLKLTLLLLASERVALMSVGLCRSEYSPDDELVKGVDDGLCKDPKTNATMIDPSARNGP